MRIRDPPAPLGMFPMAVFKEPAWAGILFNPGTNKFVKLLETFGSVFIRLAKYVLIVFVPAKNLVASLVVFPLRMLSRIMAFEQ